MHGESPSRHGDDSRPGGCKPLAKRFKGRGKFERVWRYRMNGEAIWNMILQTNDLRKRDAEELKRQTAEAAKTLRILRTQRESK